MLTRILTAALLMPVVAAIYLGPAWLFLGLATLASVLMALGMMMMPPTTVALPLKILMFVLVDGWSLVLKALVGSFH